MNSTPTGQSFQNSTMALANPCTTREIALHPQVRRVETNCNSANPRWSGVMREFMHRLDEILNTDPTRVHTLNSGIRDLLSVVREYISQEYPKSSFLANLLLKCAQVPTAKRPTVLGIWAQIQSDPAIKLMESSSRKPDNALIDKFKLAFIETLSELKPDQCLDMLTIRNNVTKGLPHVNFLVLDLELKQNPHIRKIYQDHPDLCPTTSSRKTGKNQDHGQSLKRQKTIVEHCQRRNLLFPDAATSGHSGFPFTNETTSPFLKESTAQIGSYMNTMPQMQLHPIGLSISNPQKLTVPALPTKAERVDYHNFSASKSVDLNQSTTTSWKEATGKLDVAVEILFKPHNFNVVPTAQKEIMDELVKVIRNGCRTPMCQFHILNHLITESQIKKKRKFFNSKTSGVLLLWTICVVLKDPVFVHSVSGPGVTQLSLNVSALQTWFNTVFSGYKKKEFHQFVAIRQYLSKGLHCELNVIDEYAFSGRGILHWMEFVAEKPLRTPEDWISSTSPLMWSPKQNRNDLTLAPASVPVKPLQGGIKSFVASCREEAARIQSEKIKEEQNFAKMNKLYEQKFVSNEKPNNYHKQQMEEFQGSIITNETNSHTIKVRIASTSQPHHVDLPLKSSASTFQNSTSGNTSLSSSNRSSNSKTSTYMSESAGSSWTASIIPTHRKGEPVSRNQHISTINAVNNLASSSNKPSLSKLEELRLKASKDEAITTLSSVSSFQKKECSMVLLKEDFMAEEYVDYICSPRLKSVSLIKVFGKYRIKIAHHPISGSEPIVGIVGKVTGGGI